MAKHTHCTVADCDRSPVAKGLCSTHYSRLRRSGKVGGQGICLTGDCERPPHAQGMCAKHYMRTLRGSDAQQPTARDLSVEERFWLKVDKGGPNGCWTWLGFRYNGYGRFNTAHREQTMAHRFAYEQMVGPIPAGLHLDHLCRNRSCVNPDHLEPVTCAENILRGVGFAAVNARKTHCKRGHPLSGSNLYIDTRGGRNCRTCRRGQHG